ncbi:MAG: ATP-binding protein [Rhodospirillales bacterium]|jgi:light-regulated signal transduction histidine kinase (bacteriophytochrome)|nr:ATP-binding protein [Rhodospirillales bacterium]MDP7099060.1 ATP-binding protein [Rhodospirillales bacterium]MDP7215961.1 ATP-binding protein [Rhodospirillales bacterium]HJP54685.1 ATP-binding protein [Rhodospirillales bacterium]
MMIMRPPLTPTRWKLRKAVKAVNEVLGSLRIEKHPDKTFIGRIKHGLGLYLCPKYAEMHSGTLTVESREGQGTTISICFPPERTIHPS